MTLPRFLSDENLDIPAVNSLKKQGIDIKSIQELKMRAEKDEKITKYAKQQQRTIITKDTDFLRLDAQGEKHHGIIFLT